MKKKLPTQSIMNELKGSSVFFSQDRAPARSKKVEHEGIAQPQSAKKDTSEVTRQSTQKVTPERDRSSDNSRAKSREKLRDLPTRDEIQEFSFRLRDILKVKVQAEVPHYWQDELEEIAHELNIKKLELYRFIIGEFLGKVKRGK